jgi:hypothetical protein
VTALNKIKEDNKIISCIKNANTEQNKKQIFHTLPVVRGCLQGDNLLTPFTVIRLVLTINSEVFNATMFCYSL